MFLFRSAGNTCSKAKVKQTRSPQTPGSPDHAGGRTLLPRLGTGRGRRNPGDPKQVLGGKQLEERRTLCLRRGKRLHGGILSGDTVMLK